MSRLYTYTKRGSPHKGHACKVNQRSWGWYDGKLLALCCDCGSYFVGARECFKELDRRSAVDQGACLEGFKKRL